MPSGRSAHPSAAARSFAPGYSLVVVVMLITVMSILVAAALPLWSAQIKRDKEEELISRGMQYAEAIRVFQRRFGHSLSKSARRNTSLRCGPIGQLSQFCRR